MVVVEGHCLCRRRERLNAQKGNGGKIGKKERMGGQSGLRVLQQQQQQVFSRPFFALALQTKRKRP